jgi:hypothetical protein
MGKGHKALAYTSSIHHNSFSSLQRRTVGSPMIAKTILAHVVSRWCRFHFRFTLTRRILSQLQSNPVREVLTVFDQLLADRIAYFVEADGTVWHYGFTQSKGVFVFLYSRTILMSSSNCHSSCSLILSKSSHDRSLSAMFSPKSPYYKYIRMCGMPISYGYT